MIEYVIFPLVLIGSLIGAALFCLCLYVKVAVYLTLELIGLVIRGWRWIRG